MLRRGAVSLCVIVEPGCGDYNSVPKHFRKVRLTCRSVDSGRNDLAHYNFITRYDDVYIDQSTDFDNFRYRFVVGGTLLPVLSDKRRCGFEWSISPIFSAMDDDDRRKRFVGATVTVDDDAAMWRFVRGFIVA